jgi:hypothetical protein
LTVTTVLAIRVLLGHLDLLLGYPTVDLWVLLCTPRQGGQVLSAQYNVFYQYSLLTIMIKLKDHDLI